MLFFSYVVSRFQYFCCEEVSGRAGWLFFLIEANDIPKVTRPSKRGGFSPGNERHPGQQGTAAQEWRAADSGAPGDGKSPGSVHTAVRGARGANPHGALSSWQHKGSPIP